MNSENTESTENRGNTQKAGETRDTTKPEDGPNWDQVPHQDASDEGWADQGLGDGVEPAGEEPETFAQWDPNTYGEESSADGRSKGGVVVLAVLAVLIAGLSYWWLSGRSQDAPEVGIAEPPRSAVPAAPDPDPGDADSVTPNDEELPALAASDELVRRLVSELSSHPRLAQFLVPDSLIERTVRVVANLAYGEDPRAHLKALRPPGEFEVERSGADPGTFRISVSQSRRFDPAVAVFTSLDTAGTADLYRRLAPLFEEAHDELGLPGTFEDTLRRAIREIEEVAEVRDPLVERGGVDSYRYVDPRLEGLGDGQKILLRMGDANRRRVVQRVRELAGALGF